jgi:shikimate kinase
MSDNGDQPLVVVGLMGSGKTTVGRLLAKALGREFRDSDADLERRYGQSAAQQQAQAGTDTLHAREATVLREAIVDRPAAVIAAAASVVEDARARAALKDGAFVVWLDAPPAVLASRIHPGDHRPYYHPDPETMLTQQYAERGSLFREVADLIVDVSRATPEQIAATILAAVPPP